MLFVSYFYKKNLWPWSRFRPASLIIKEKDAINNINELYDLHDYIKGHHNAKYVPYKVRIIGWQTIGSNGD